MRLQAVLVVLVAAAGAVLLTSQLVRSQSAPPQVDPEWQKEQEAKKKKQVDQAVRRAKAGKNTVVEIGTLKLGDRELVRVTLEDEDNVRHVALVPCFPDKEKAWVAPADLVKALREVPRGNVELIHTDERYGVEWVVGVGQGSPDTLENLEKQVKNRKWTAEAPAAGQGGEDAPEVVRAKSTGIFVELGQGSIEGIEARVLVVERGVAATQGKFWLVSVDRNGKFVRSAANVLKIADSLKKGDRLEIEYTQVGDFMLINGLRKLED